jgi:hypothetical protein
MISPLSARFHHLAYGVDRLDEAIADAATRLGAGPFFVLRDVPLAAIADGEPVAFEHSSAFGRWGDTFLELMQIDRCDRDRIHTPIPGINHLAWAVPTLEAAGRELDGGGMPEILRAELGDIAFVLHDAQEQFGHNVELHADSEGFRAFFRQIAEASESWDGRDPIREPDF